MLLLRAEVERRYGPQDDEKLRRLSNMMRKMIGPADAATVDDVRQELTFKLLAAQKNWPPSYEEFEPYCLRALRNLLIDRGRRAESERARIEEVRATRQEADASSLEDMVYREALRQVWTIIEELTADEQDIAAAVMNGTPEAEIAEARHMDLPRVKAVRLRLRRKIRNRFIELNVDWRELLARLQRNGR